MRSLSLTSAAVQVTAPDTPEASSTSPAASSSSVSIEALSFAVTMTATCQARKHADGSGSDSPTRSVVSTPSSLASCADAPGVDSDCAACWDTPTPIAASSAVVSVTLNSDSAATATAPCQLRKYDCDPPSASPSVVVSTPPLVSCTSGSGSTPSCASTLDHVDPDSSACWETVTPPLSVSTSTPTPAPPTRVASSIYSYKRLSLPFAVGWADKLLRSTDVSAADCASPTPKAPPSQSVVRERPRSVGVGRPHPVSGVGLGFNYMLGFDFPSVAIAVADDPDTLLEDDDDEAVSTASSSQTIGALSSPSVSSSDGSPGPTADARKRLSDLVEAMDTSFSGPPAATHRRWRE